MSKGLRAIKYTHLKWITRQEIRIIMNKKTLQSLIVKQLEENLETLLDAAKATYERSTHAETKAENKYDTFGLEASYLAHGQSVRVQEAKQALTTFKALRFTEFNKDTPITQSALITLETEDGNISIVLLATEAGGVQVNYKNQEITIVSLQSPLGKQLLGKYQHDIFELNIANTSVEYEIINVI